MASIHNQLMRPAQSSATTTSSLLAFLVPTARFSTSPIRCKKDNNSNRGVSAVRGTGLRKRQTLSVMPKPTKDSRISANSIPRPVPIDVKVTGTPDHGLWDFFKSQTLLQTPVDESSHGRSWTVGELRSRDWDTLHQLWWVCVKERNRLATEKIERTRLDAGYGDVENQERDKTIQETMKAVLDTLSERQQAYTAALELAKQDPNIDLSRTDGPQFTEPAYVRFNG
jgi:large subunit ribosomal protein L47